MAKVIKAFRDKEDGQKHYAIGDIYQGDRLDYLADLGYVQPDFSDMTVKELKALLDSEGIEYSSDAKKAELVGLAEGV